MHVTVILYMSSTERYNLRSNAPATINNNFFEFGQRDVTNMTFTVLFYVCQNKTFKFMFYDTLKCILIEQTVFEN